MTAFEDIIKAGKMLEKQEMPTNNRYISASPEFVEQAAINGLTAQEYFDWLMEQVDVYCDNRDSQATSA